MGSGRFAFLLGELAVKQNIKRLQALGYNVVLEKVA